MKVCNFLWVYYVCLITCMYLWNWVEFFLWMWNWINVIYSWQVLKLVNFWLVMMLLSMGICPFLIFWVYFAAKVIRIMCYFISVNFCSYIFWYTDFLFVFFFSLCCSWLFKKWLQVMNFEGLVISNLSNELLGLVSSPIAFIDPIFPT